MNRRLRAKGLPWRLPRIAMLLATLQAMLTSAAAVWPQALLAQAPAQSPVAPAAAATGDAPDGASAKDKTSGKDPAAKGTASAAADALVVEQAKIADSYARFKNELLKLAELTRATDPAKADLLEKAVQQISASGTDDQLRGILKLLDSDLLSDVDQAVEKQGQVETDLNSLLQLLLSENRDRRNASEKDRLRGYIKELEQTIKIEKGIQGQSERNGDTKDLAKRQGQLADRTGKLAKKIAENEESKREGAVPKDGTPGGEKPQEPGKGSDKSAPKDAPKDKDKNKNDKGQGGDKPDKKPDAKPADGKSNDGKPKDGKPSDGKPSDGKPSDGKPADGKPADGKPADGKSSKNGKSGDSKPGDSPEAKPPGEDQPAGESPDEPTNGRKRIEQAVEKMRNAQKRLEETKRSEAVPEQEKAIAALEKAKAELEEILRQVREEEVEKTLAMLEARFRNMLKLQQAVYDATVLLDKKPQADRNRSDEIEASRLSRKEQQIIEEVDKTMLLLREDGSAVAFPEAISQLREDMDLIAQRLNQSKISTVTQRMEQDVIDAIKDLIAAMEKAQKDLQQKRGQPMQPGQPADPPLVNSIAEIKMIRALQVRVNRRTQQYEEMVHSGESSAADMLPRLRQLADHEQKIHRIARDLQLGKNE